MWVQRIIHGIVDDCSSKLALQRLLHDNQETPVHSTYLIRGRFRTFIIIVIFLISINSLWYQDFWFAAYACPYIWGFQEFEISLSLLCKPAGDGQMCTCAEDVCASS